MNTFGEKFAFTSFGESHGRAIGGVLDGVPAGLHIDLTLIQSELARRAGRKPTPTPSLKGRELGERLEVRGVILNAGGYTHTSVALRDAVACCQVPVVEVHISNIAEREEFRRVSLLTDVCQHSIIGHGTDGYREAVEWVVEGLRLKV